MSQYSNNHQSEIKSKNNYPYHFKLKQISIAEANH